MIGMDWIFEVILKASLASAVMILLLLFIRKLYQPRLNPRIMHILWFIVLVKLLVPISPSSSISVFNWMPSVLADRWITNESHSSAPSGLIEQREGSLTGSIDMHQPIGGKQSAIQQHEEGRLSSSKLEEPVSEGPVSRASFTANSGSWASMMEIGLWIWLGGLAIFALYHLAVGLRFRKQLSQARQIHNPEVLAVLRACSEKLAIKRSIPVFEIGSFHSPFICGVIKPKVYLPEDIAVIADPQQLTHVLMHELAHYKRKDLWSNALWTLAVWLHWFNPMAWLARQKMASDREVACDAVVLEALGERDAASYGMTLLRMSRLAAREVSVPANLSYFFHKNNETKRRVTMIAKFKQGSYKLSVIAILLIVALGAVLLTNPNHELNASQIENEKKQSETSLLEIDRLIPSFKRFHNLNRALAFSPVEFKVPDYIPEGYQLENVYLNENFGSADKADLIQFATITYVSNFGQVDERNIDIYASEGKGTLLEHNLLWGGAISGSGDRTPLYQQEELTIGDLKGVMYTSAKPRYKKEPATANSFVWQEGDTTYAVNYFVNELSQEELEKIVQSFVLPNQVQHVDYEGKGNSFLLYEDSDLQEAKHILGFPVKFPVAISDYGLKLSDAAMQRANDQNTGYAIRPGKDALNLSYRVPYNSTIYELNDTIDFYQSKEPVVDVNKLMLVQELEMNGVKIAAYEDKEQVYMGPYYSDHDQTKFKTQTYYVWEEDGIFYTALFNGVDEHREDNLRALVLAPVE